MKLAISITTYNRPNLLLTQLKELGRQLEHGGHEATIFVVNDASIRKYTKVEEQLEKMPYETRYDRFVTNQGKKKHWRVVNHIFEWYRRQQFEYAIYLQDDCVLERDFLPDLLAQFKAIGHSKKVALNYVLEPSRINKPVWTPVQPRVYKYSRYKIFRVGWLDLHFIANENFFSTLNYNIHPIGEGRWADDKTRSSGVGRQISFRLFRSGHSMWQVTSSLVTHGIHKSWMNPISRKSNPNFKSI